MLKNDESNIIADIDFLENVLTLGGKNNREMLLLISNLDRNEKTISFFIHLIYKIFSLNDVYLNKLF